MEPNSKLKADKVFCLRLSISPHYLLTNVNGDYSDRKLKFDCFKIVLQNLKTQVLFTLKINAR